MHIFLTGAIQVGKSTIIRKVLSQSGMVADGFMTYWEAGDDGEQKLFLSQFGLDSRADERYLIEYDRGRKIESKKSIEKAFDSYGSSILENSGKCDIIVMDELGFLESGAALFQQAVLRHVSGDVPILGVIKPAQTEFLDGIRTHAKVKVMEVTVKNRDEVRKSVLELFP